MMCRPDDFPPYERELERQRAFRASPEQQAIRLDRIARGLCVLEDGRCVTHDVPDSMSHHFAANPGAYND